MLIYGVCSGLTSQISFDNHDITEPIQNNMPYYIDDEINAILEQLEVYNQTINYYENELLYTFQEKKKLELRKKIADLKVKCSRLENKYNKLLDKWEG